MKIIPFEKSLIRPFSILYLSVCYPFRTLLRSYPFSVLSSGNLKIRKNMLYDACLGDQDTEKKQYCYLDI